MKQNDPKSKPFVRKHKNRFLSVVASSLFLLFLFSAVMFITQALQAKHEQDAFSDLAVIVLEAEQNFSMDEAASNEAVQEATETQEQTSPHYEATETQEQTSPHYDELYEMNSDFIGWLNIPNTNIDYPVMFTPGEPEYYLRRAFDKTSSQSGTPFIGENGNIDSDCLIIYGHNMKNDTMFGTLDNYADKAFWMESRTLSFNTLYDYQEYEVFAAVKTTIPHTDETGFRYYNYSGNLSQTEYKELVDCLLANAIYNTGIDPVYGEQILILSTCSYHTENGRFLVAARRIE
ncbi:MAG: class B sortase [Clostridium sp.]|nr:class B sortase [Clostridium sp.]